MNIPKRYKSHKTYTFCALSKVYSKREILTDSLVVVLKYDYEDKKVLIR